MSRSEVAITVENLSKRYKLGLMHAGSIRELVNGVTDRLLGRRQEQRVDATEFWALRDINFTVQEGEVVGLIGRNGAGKSTLLKILSRITKPTTGRARIHGRVGSLLEVGTGFHPELTGRENIFLNGTMLGMSTREISRKLDQIIDFSEIEKFIDTPVKRYSSGMYVRLAFAVAAHLEPEVLIVDEVLAVGDVAFQRKCLGKMESVGKSGRTVLFVSHNMGAVKKLCERAILLSNGSLVEDGRPSDVVDHYLRNDSHLSVDGWVSSDQERAGTAEARVLRVQLLNHLGASTSELFLDQTFKVAIDFEAYMEMDDIHFEVNIHTVDGLLLTATHRDLEHEPSTIQPGKYTVYAELDLRLMPGVYSLGVNVYRQNGVSIDLLERLLDFEVHRYQESSERLYRWNEVRGLVHPVSRWKLQRTSAESDPTSAKQQPTAG